MYRSEALRQSTVGLGLCGWGVGACADPSWPEKVLQRPFCRERTRGRNRSFPQKASSPQYGPCLPLQPAPWTLQSLPLLSLSFPSPPTLLLGRKRRTKHIQKGRRNSSECKLLVLLRSDCGNGATRSRMMRLFQDPLTRPVVCLNFCPAACLGNLTKAPWNPVWSQPYPLPIPQDRKEESGSSWGKVCFCDRNRHQTLPLPEGSGDVTGFGRCSERDRLFFPGL